MSSVDEARLFLDPFAANYLDTKVLHAEEGNGTVRFLITEQREDYGRFANNNNSRRGVF